MSGQAGPDDISCQVLPGSLHEAFHKGGSQAREALTILVVRCCPWGTEPGQLSGQGGLDDISCQVLPGSLHEAFHKGSSQARDVLTVLVVRSCPWGIERG